jgi:type I restriction-modification system DNA methylase subunit
MRLMVDMTTPNSMDVICDAASGTCGFLVAAGEYLRGHYLEILRDAYRSSPRPIPVAPARSTPPQAASA